MSTVRGGLASVLAAVLVLGGGGCSADSRSRTATTNTPEPSSSSIVAEATTTGPAETSTSVAASAQSSPATTVAEVRIVATVAATFASARVIQLVEPVQGYSEVAFTSATRYRRSSGQAATLADLQPGSRIEVRGTRGSAAALLAREVVLLG
ncbi:MAG: hypothetical protein ACRD1K_06910 [Acidimicrobiales bacterium]